MEVISLSNHKMKIWTILIILMVVNMINLATAIDYTYSSKTECNGKVCNKVLYSGTQFAKNSKGNWVNWQDAQSLKDNGFAIKYLENDGTHKIEVLDFNATSIRVKLDLKGITIFPYSTDLKVLDISKSDASNFKLGAVELSKQTASFSLFSQSQTLTIPFGYNKAIEFGKNSTTIILQDADSENLADGWVDEDHKNLNYGADTILSATRFEDNIFIKFNLSSIPTGSSIENALLKLTRSGGILGETVTFYIYPINNSWNEGSGDSDTNTATINGTTWNERWYSNGTTSNWSVKGGDYYNKLNLTYNIYEGSPFNVNVTKIVVGWHNQSIENYGFFITTSFYQETYYSKEYSTVTSRRPLLNITYTLPPSLMTNCTAYSGTGNYTTSCDCLLNTTLDLGGNSFITNTSGTLITEANVTNIGSWKLENGCKIVIGNGRRFG